MNDLDIHAQPELVAAALRLVEQIRSHAYQVGLKENSLRAIAAVLSRKDLEFVIKAMQASAPSPPEQSRRE